MLRSLVGSEMCIRDRGYADRNPAAVEGLLPSERLPPRAKLTACDTKLTDGRLPFELFASEMLPRGFNTGVVRFMDPGEEEGAPPVPEVGWGLD
eukprot:TRINITY_DN9207_c0_g1_i8.p2 TRINITY_DN9207_c0_g1~~TRINITY_DN9207_c0_g1_i8.p2  ORF type:complete len:109 (+),score=35.12 TRINITY_DN9207_c0_g1_i8:46-327(+)